MRIWHLEAEPRPDAVNGASNSAWEIALAQAQAGHEVTLFVDKPEVDSGVLRARAAGMRLAYVPAFPWAFGARCMDHAEETGMPDVVQMHSVFIPRHAVLGRTLRQWGIPYVIKPAGGLQASDLQRGWLKKRVYIALAERRRFMQSAAVVGLTPIEEQEIRAFVPDYRGRICSIPNPIAQQLSVEASWAGRPAGQRFVFMGRFDVYQKGLDLLATIARQAPELQFDLYGEGSHRGQKELAELRGHAPVNMHFHLPVTGSAKTQALRHADGLILTSRFEAFGRVVADAMAMGLPCFVSESTAVASLFRLHDLGTVLSKEPIQAAADLRKALRDPERIQACARRASQYVRTELTPENVTRRYLQLYAQVVEQAQPAHAGEVAYHG